MDYWYAILGGLLIILPPWVDKDMKRKWKIVLIVVAAIYSAFGMYLSHQSKIEEAEARREHKEEIKSLRSDMTKMLTSSSGVLPLIASLNSEVAILQRETEAAREKHDPRVIADLQARANTAQQVSNGVSDRLLIAMTPNAAQQLREFGEDWNSAEGKEIIANAEYLRQVMARRLKHETDQDRAAATMFSKARAGDYLNWSPVAAANYLQELKNNVVPVSPINLQVTVK